jgi:hypothetical protein
MGIFSSKCTKADEFNLGYGSWVIPIGSSTITNVNTDPTDATPGSGTGPTVVTSANCFQFMEVCINGGSRCPTFKPLSQHTLFQMFTDLTNETRYAYPAAPIRLLSNDTAVTLSTYFPLMEQAAAEASTRCPSYIFQGLAGAANGYDLCGTFGEDYTASPYHFPQVTYLCMYNDAASYSIMNCAMDGSTQPQLLVSVPLAQATATIIPVCKGQVGLGHKTSIGQIIVDSTTTNIQAAFEAVAPKVDNWKPSACFSQDINNAYQYMTISTCVSEESVVWQTFVNLTYSDSSNMYFLCTCVPDTTLSTAPNGTAVAQVSAPNKATVFAASGLPVNTPSNQLASVSYFGYFLNARQKQLSQRSPAITNCYGCSNVYCSTCGQNQCGCCPPNYGSGQW